MVAVAWLLRDFDSLLAAPLAVGAYAAALYAVGGIDRDQIAMLRRSR
jgi:hypothetical protein